MIHSIYKIINKLNGKLYIGYTSMEPCKRYKFHVGCSQSTNKVEKQHIHNAMSKHGVNNFIFEVIYQSLDGEHCLSMESYFIKEYDTFNTVHGYNHTSGGEDRKRSTATIEKHRKKMLGRPQSEEHKKNRGKSISGSKNGMYGRKLNGSRNGMYGKKISEMTGYIEWKNKFNYYYVDIWGNVFDTKSKEELIQLMGVKNWYDVTNSMKTDYRHRNGYKYIGRFVSLLD